MNRRRFSLLGLGGIASAALVACGNDIGDENAINPTKIPDVPGAPKPTLADMATPGGEAPEEGGAAGGGAAGGGGPIILEAHDPFNWSTKELTAAPGDVISVTNTGVVPHDFAIDEYGGVLFDLPAGGSGEWTVPADATGSYVYYCAVPGHRQSGMEGTLTIGEASAPPAEGQAPAAGGPVVLEAHDPFNWSTKELTAAPGDVISVTNTGVVPHDFAIDEYGGVLFDLPAGGSGEWTVPADATGSYVFYCAVPGHRQSGMEGTLTIGEASAPPAEGGGSPVAEQPPAEGAAPPAGGGGPIVLEAHDPFSWSTKELTAKPGDVISVTNTGVIPHDFAIDEYGGVLFDLPAGGSGEWTVPADATGSYVYYCAVPGHRQSGMEGTLTIG